MSSALSQTERLLDQMEFPKLFKIALNGDPTLGQRLLDIVVGIWRGEMSHNSGKTPSSRCSTKKRIGQSAAATRVSRRWCTPARYYGR